MLHVPDDAGPASPRVRFIQALAGKGLETVRLTEALSISPGNEAARAALAEHLSELRQSATELGFVHLEAAVAEALTRLERESFGPRSLVAVRMLAWRYETLAALPAESGTHPVVEDEQPLSNARLRGRRVLVADDEAEVRWFYVGVLREAGARVVEARDGLEALELARSDPPDLILADIVMPRLDGLGLCAAVRREPALDGVPLVLLSWRDDFLHRMRELQADAQDYLRKEVSATQILDRVSGVLEPLTRLEERLKSGQEAHGDLEQLGVAALLRATRRLRPNAAVALQDPWSLFDIALREGRIVDVTRTAIDGAITKGVAALPALVGMSSGRFVVAEAGPLRVDEGGESLDASFAAATRRLGALISAMSDRPDCRIELDHDVLGTYSRHSPARMQRLIARLVQGEPPQALWESGAGSRSLVDTLLVTLARQGAVRGIAATNLPTEVAPAVSSTGFGPELGESEILQGPSLVPSAVDRENIRAQSGVDMHREPANRAQQMTSPIWRLNAGASTGSGENGSGFGLEIQTMPRLLGLAFVVMLSVTVGFLVWHQVMPGAAPAGSPTAGPVRPDPQEQVSPDAPMAEPPSPSSSLGLSTFAGELRAGVDPSLKVGEGQGVLELMGPSEVRIEVDRVDQGVLPLTVVLDQGRHTVRYRVGTRSTYRFYYVKSGATRALSVVTQPGGLVDAR